MKVKTTFNFYSDPGHGWLKVPKSVLDVLGIAGKITPYSYQRGENAYLEEDADATLFINSFKSKYGIEPTIKTRSADRRSRIRFFDQYKN